MLVPYLAELGVTDVYLSPPFAAAPGSMHGYDVVDHNRCATSSAARPATTALCQALADARHGAARRLRAQPHGHRPAQPLVDRRARERPVVALRALLRRRLEPGQAGAGAQGAGAGARRSVRRGARARRAQAGARGRRLLRHATGSTPSRSTPRQVPRLLGHRLDALRAELGASDLDLQELREHRRRRWRSWRRATRSRATPSPSARAKRRWPSGAWPRSSRPARASPPSSTRTCASTTARPASRAASICLDELLGASGLSARALARRRRGDQLPPLLRHQLARRHPHGGRARLRRHAPAASSASSPRARSPACASTTPTGCTRRRPTSGACSASTTGSTSSSRRSSRATRRCRRRGRSTAPPATSGSTRSTACSSTARTAPPSTSSTRASPASRQKWHELVDRQEAQPHALVDGLRDQHALATGSTGCRRAIDARATSRSTRSPARSSTTWRGCRSTAPTSRATTRRRSSSAIASTSSRPSARAKRGSRELNRTIFDFLRSILLARACHRRVARVRAQAAAGDRAGDGQGHRGHGLLRLQPARVAQRGRRRSAALRRHRRGVPPRQRRAAAPTGPARSTPPPPTTPSAARTCACASTRCRRSPSSGSSASIAGRSSPPASRPSQDGELAPDANEELLVYQTLVGTFPDDGRVTDDYRARIGSYLDKALKEAKVHSSWTNPDEAYEQAMRDFADALLTSRAVPRRLRAVRRGAWRRRRDCRRWRRWR